MSIIGNVRAKVADLRVRTKLLAGFSAVVALMLFVGLVGSTSMGSLDHKATSLYQSGTNGVEDIANVRASFLLVRIEVYKFIVAPDAKVRATETAALVTVNRNLDTALATYEHHLGGSASNAHAQGAVNHFKSTRVAYDKLVNGTLLPAARAGQAKQVWAAVLAAKPIVVDLSATVDDLFATQNAAAKQLADNAHKTYRHGNTLILVLLGVGVLLATGLALLIAALICRPLGKLMSVIKGVGEGDLTRQVDLDSADELGRMAQMLNVCLERFRSSMTAIARDATFLAGSSEKLTAVSNSMGDSAHETASQATLASETADQISANAQTVAASTEQMSTSIREIAKSAAEAAGQAGRAVHVADAANVAVSTLGRSSAEISSVAKLISSIAEQTNLLALNATIEAARAGEAGKGFTVVASEVKELAQETAKATADIGSRIQAIQNDTGAAVAAISEIIEIIAQINDTQATIAAAVEEQTATTNEITRSVTESSTGTRDIASNITGVAQAAATTTRGVADAQEAALEMSRMAAELQAMVKQFHVGDAAADNPIQAAIAAHGAWKARLRTAIDNGTSDADPTVVGRDDRCEFGKWLHGDSASAPASARYRPEALTLHASFHTAAADVLRYALTNRKAEAAKAMSYGSTFATVSQQLTEHLMQWQADAQPAPVRA